MKVLVWSLDWTLWARTGIRYQLVGEGANMRTSLIFWLFLKALVLWLLSIVISTWMLKPWRWSQLLSAAVKSTKLLVHAWQRKSLYCEYPGVSKRFLLLQNVPSNWNILLYGIHTVLQVQSANSHIDFLVQEGNNLSHPRKEERLPNQDLTFCHLPAAV